METQKHHRRPVSHGGTKAKICGVDNLSVVPANRHLAYHILFNNMYPDEIAKELNRLYINGVEELNSSCRKKAWKTMFGGRKIHQIIKELNKRWIDPEWILNYISNENRFLVYVIQRYIYN